MRYATLIAYLKHRNRLKQLPEILRELKRREEREEARAPRRETAKDTPSLIHGSRSIKDGILTDTTAKQALIDIYQQITR